MLDVNTIGGERDVPIDGVMGGGPSFKTRSSILLRERQGSCGRVKTKRLASAWTGMYKPPFPHQEADGTLNAKMLSRANECASRIAARAL